MRKIVGQTPSSRQTLLVSATLDEDAIGGIRDLVSDPAVVEIAHKGSVAETIDQFALPVSREAKNALLPEVLKQEGPKRVIVFCRTKHRADACCRRLRRANISCAPIHGDRSQNQRERALRAFRDGSCDVLVATDVLARGIDVSDVRYVVNFDVPVDAEDYIHRIGRTGRAGEAGWALTFVTENRRRRALRRREAHGQGRAAHSSPPTNSSWATSPWSSTRTATPRTRRPLGKKARKKREEARKAASAAARKRALAKPRAEKSEKLAEHDKPAKTGGAKAPKAGGAKKDRSSKAAKSQRLGSAKLTRRRGRRARARRPRASAAAQPRRQARRQACAVARAETGARSRAAARTASRPAATRPRTAGGAPRWQGRPACAAWETAPAASAASTRERRPKQGSAGPSADAPHREHPRAARPSATRPGRRRATICSCTHRHLMGAPWQKPPTKPRRASTSRSSASATISPPSSPTRQRACSPATRRATPASVTSYALLVLIVIAALAPATKGNVPLLVGMVVVEVVLWGLADRWPQVQLRKLRHAGLDTALIPADKRRRTVAV